MMTRSLTLVIVTVAALGGGTVGSVITAFLLTPLRVTSTSIEKEKSSSGANPPSEAAAEELDELRARLNSLDRRLSILTFSKAPALPTASEQKNLDAKDTDASAGHPVDDPVFEAAVRDVLDQVKYERDAERDARRAERRAKSMSRWSTRLSERLGLNSAQAESLKALVTDHMAALRRLRENQDPNVPLLRTEWRARAKAVSDQTDQKLAALLDASQKAKYDALDNGDKLGRRGWGRGGGD